MRLYFDIETRSAADLKVVGTPNYWAHPTTQVICLSYAIDDGPVQTRGLGEGLGDEFVSALETPGVQLVAHNISFDINALQRVEWEGQMVDTAAKCARSNVPRALKDAANFLGLEYKKASKGRMLIARLSRPKSVDPLVWNEQPEVLEQMYAYNRQDVEVCRAIDKALPDLSEEEQRVWELDFKINSRGIGIDRAFIAKGLAVVEAEKAAADAEIKRLTDGEVNAATETAKITAWAKRQGADVASLAKWAVAEMDLSKLPPKVAQVIEIRSGAAKTSTAKIQKVAEELSADGRIRSQLVYHGASTGRWCLLGDHEVLTESGWVPLETWAGGKIAVWNPTEQVSFMQSQALKFDFSGQLVVYDTNRICQASTLDHKMPGWNVKTGQFEPWLAGDFKRRAIPYTGSLKKPSGMLDAELRVLVMVQADGHYCDTGLRLKFRKARKIERCYSLLRRAGIVFSVAKYEQDTVFHISRRHMPLFLDMFTDKTFGWWMLNADAGVVFSELEHWDGYRCGPNSMQYTSTNKQNIDVLQAVAHTSGLAASITKGERTHDKWSPCWALNVWLSPSNRHELRGKPAVVPHSGPVYCAETPSGFFLVRRNGRVWVTGNSGRGAQPQNFPKLKKGLESTLAEFMGDQ